MSATSSINHISLGARVMIRDEEWLVRKIDRSSSGAAVLGVVGLSPLVEGKEARFIDSIERESSGISIVDPRNKLKVTDASPYFRASRLAIESRLRLRSRDRLRSTSDTLRPRLTPTKKRAQPRTVAEKLSKDLMGWEGKFEQSKSNLRGIYELELTEDASEHSSKHTSSPQ